MPHPRFLTGSQRVALLAACLLAAACTDRALLTAPLGVAPAPAASPLAALQCRGDAVARTVSCTPASTTSRSLRDLIVGGQDRYVHLATASASSSAGVLSVDVTVQNLLSEPMATTDGSSADPSGVRVFFATSPSNGVTLGNATGVAAFTASGQPYFGYSGADLGADGILAPSETSSPVTWQFVLNGASTFVFTVYVSAAVPAEQGILRMRLDEKAVTDQALGGVWGVSGSDVFAVGASGTIAHSDGTSWHAMSSGVSSYLNTVWGTGHANVWAAGDGTMLHFDGTGWSSVSIGTTASFSSIWGSSATDVFAVTYTTGEIFHYDGVTWSPMPRPGSGSLAGVWGSSASNVYAVSDDDATILHYDGTTWTAIPASPDPTVAFSSVWGSGASDIYVPSYDGRILHFNGTTWSFQDAGATAYAISGSSASDVTAVGASGVILHSTGDGTWTATIAPEPYLLYGVWAASAANAVVVANSGVILRGNGSHWNVEQSGGAFRSIWGSSASDVYAVGSLGGSARHFNGSTWSTVDLGTPNLIQAVWGTSASDVFAAGYQGTITHWNGSSWTLMPSGSATYLTGVWGSSPGNVYAVGGGGTILHYDGSAWLPIASGVSADLNAIWGSSATDIYAAGMGGTLLHYDGTAWNSIPTPGQDSFGVWGSSASDVYVVGGNATVMHFDGTSWSTVLSGGPEYFLGAWGSSPNDVFVVGASFNSSTGSWEGSHITHWNGSSWSEVASGSANGLFSVWGSSSRDIIAGGLGSTLMHGIR